MQRDFKRTERAEPEVAYRELGQAIAVSGGKSINWQRLSRKENWVMFTFIDRVSFKGMK
jgi:hypothetical protein